MRTDAVPLNSIRSIWLRADGWERTDLLKWIRISAYSLTLSETCLSYNIMRPLLFMKDSDLIQNRAVYLFRKNLKKKRRNR